MSLKKQLCQYPTPAWVAEAIIERHFQCLDSGDCVVDPSCGPGAFLQAIPAHVQAIGVEIDSRVADEAIRNTGRPVIVGDFQSIHLDIQPTLILGNPPFKLKLIDAFLDKSHSLLLEGGRVGFILPSYAFQTAARVVRYSDQWSLFQEMVPRNMYPGLSLPLVFALFAKDKKRLMVGFALYREAAAIQQFAEPYRAILRVGASSVWREVVEAALLSYGGEASVKDLYAEIGGKRPTQTQFWQQKIRQTLRRYSEWFVPVAPGRYRLQGVPLLNGICL